LFFAPPALAQAPPEDGASAGERPSSAEEGASGEAAETPSGDERESESPPEPAEEAVAGPPPPAGRATDRTGNPLVAVHFRSPTPELRFFLGPALVAPDPYGGPDRPAPGELRELCAAPCARWIYPGQYALGIARPEEDNGRLPTRADEAAWFDGPALVTGEYHSYGWVRVLGWATMGLGIVSGSALVLYAFDRCAGDGLCLQNTPSAWFGAGAFFAGVTGGLLLTLKEDEVSFSVTPAAGLPDPP
jgi:hypothetical protein